VFLSTEMQGHGVGKADEGILIKLTYPFMTLGARHHSSPRASGPRAVISSLVFSSTIIASQLALGSPTALVSANWLMSQPKSEHVHL
jgi:hypothetical protein